MLSSKKIDEKLQNYNFQELEKEFQRGKNFFENLNEKIKWDEIQLKFPAFCLVNQEIIIKFPTYKIRIINNKMSHNDLRELLKDIYNYQIDEETNVVMFSSLEPVQSTAIHCLETNLDANTCTAKEIEKKLEEQHIRTERCVDYGYYCIPIKVDEEGYITVIKR
ncbi:hypothetical protein FC976_00310 [Clostridium sporogenes]|uniref:hypothetical protein n=1 Tax=Clostridium sporogenes TaxID=1509 RepID=UPI0013D20A8A|nr:hypothetical protein [Clostridium sporogenes]NFH45694.1 hypothetical protein [Clostridium sporogenes]